MNIEKIIEINYNLKSYLGNNTIIFNKEMEFYNTYICDNYDDLFYYLIDELDLLKFTLYKEYKNFMQVFLIDGLPMKDPGSLECS